MTTEIWNLSREPTTFEEAKLFTEEIVRRQIQQMRVFDPARYTYAWRDRGTAHNLQVFRNGKLEFFISVEDRASGQSTTVNTKADTTRSDVEGDISLDTQPKNHEQ